MSTLKAMPGQLARAARPKRAARGEPTVAVQILQALLGRAAALGLSTASLIANAGVDPAVLDDVDGRVPARIVRALWEELPIACMDPRFGLNLAASVPDGALGLVAYMMLHAPTLGQGFVAAVRYARLLQDVAACSVEPVAVRRGRSIGLRFVQAPLPGGPRPPRHAVEFGFARAILMARRSTGVELVPTRVRFTFERPAGAGDYAPMFGARVAFGHARNELELDEATLALPQRAADPLLRAAVEARSRSLLDRLDQRGGFAGDVAAALGEAIQRGCADLSTVARALELSERTLQRRLGAEGLTFRDLADGARRELAAQLLADRTHSLSQIALLLGFSEQAAFQRAFVRWTGMTPGRFRRRATASVARSGNPAAH
jgi:AraC-like DNA-binding protein